jgi:hypothetical protein
MAKPARDPTAIGGFKKNVDGSHLFHFVGGPYDGCKFRSYPPFEPITFPEGSRSSCTYFLNPPYGRYRSWVYVVNKQLQEVPS